MATMPKEVSASPQATAASNEYQPVAAHHITITTQAAVRLPLIDTREQRMRRETLTPPEYATPPLPQRRPAIPLPADPWAKAVQAKGGDGCGPPDQGKT